MQQPFVYLFAVNGVYLCGTAISARSPRFRSDTARGRHRSPRGDLQNYHARRAWQRPELYSCRGRFNNLCSQFENNPKYVSFDYKFIPDDEDIAYEMIVRNKRYVATFCQRPILLTEPSELEKYLKTKYNEAVWDNLTPEQHAELTKHFMEISLKKPVWFIIADYFGKYYIAMFYDNEYNRANGEDL